MAAAATNKKPDSVFADHGMGSFVRAICEEVRELYLWDEIPWVVG